MASPKTLSLRGIVPSEPRYIVKEQLKKPSRKHRRIIAKYEAENDAKIVRAMKRQAKKGVTSVMIDVGKAQQMLDEIEQKETTDATIPEEK